MTLSELLTDFADFYLHISADFQPGKESRLASNARELAIERINSGDCGTAALSVGWVFNRLREKALNEKITSGILDASCGKLEALIESEPVFYWDNYDHAYLQYDDKFYDTIAYQGTDDPTTLTGYRGTNVVEQLPRAELWKRYIHIDAMGARIIELYCDRWGVERCPLSTQLLETSGYVSQAWFVNWNTYAKGELQYFLENKNWRPLC